MIGLQKQQKIAQNILDLKALVAETNAKILEKEIEFMVSAGEPDRDSSMTVNLEEGIKVTIKSPVTREVDYLALVKLAKKVNANKLVVVKHKYDAKAWTKLAKNDPESYMKYKEAVTEKEGKISVTVKQVRED